MGDQTESRDGDLRIHQWLLQSTSKALSTGLAEPGRLRTESGLNEHLGRHKYATGPVHAAAPENPGFNGFTGFVSSHTEKIGEEIFHKGWEMKPPNPPNPAQAAQDRNTAHQTEG